MAMLQLLSFIRLADVAIGIWGVTVIIGWFWFVGQMAKDSSSIDHWLGVIFGFMVTGVIAAGLIKLGEGMIEWIASAIQ